MEISGFSVQERWLSIYSVMEIEAGKPLPQMFLWNHFLWERLSSRDFTLGLARSSLRA
jgi:hypothetical protein